MPSHTPSGSKGNKARAALSAPIGLKNPKPWQQAAKQKKAALSAVLYSMVKDGTLTAAQARDHAFRPGVVKLVGSRKSIAKGAFRYASNPTLEGVSSGYHEAFVVTDMTDTLSRRQKVSATHSAMPAVSSGYWSQHSHATFPEANLSPMLQAGDTARTDTARTVLTGPGGSVAGHSGSGVHTGGQSAAHDMLRDQAMRALQDPHLSPHAMGVLAAATTVFSMAPGELATQAQGAASLKDQSARTTWEDDRNEAKERLAVSFSALPSTDQARVMHHMQPLVAAAGGGRTLEPARPMTPRRERRGHASAAIQGGGYDPNASTTGHPAVALPSHADPGTISAFVTEPFRISRR